MKCLNFAEPSISSTQREWANNMRIDRSTSELIVVGMQKDLDVPEACHGAGARLLADNLEIFGYVSVAARR